MNEEKETLQEETPKEEKKETPAPSISIHGLVKSYGEKKVLTGLDLEVYPGELYGFIGKNGVGKTTTIDCLIGAKSFEKGEILIEGKSIKKNPVEAKKCFGYVASEPTCYEVMTGYDYLDFIASVYGLTEEELRKNRNYLAKRLDLKEEDMALPISSYSHGMKQKICLIASLLHTPDIWILDEPTVGLDVMAVEALKKMMRDYASSGHTVLITSHNIELVAALCDRVGIVNHGKIAKSLNLKKETNYRLRLPAIFLKEYQEEKK